MRRSTTPRSPAAPSRGTPYRLPIQQNSPRRTHNYGLTAFVVAVLALAVWGFGVGPGHLRTRRTTLTLPGLTEPRTVVLLSDVHGGAPHVDDEMLGRVVAAVNDAHPHLVLLLGDYVIDGVIGGEFMPPEHVAAALAGIEAPTLAVLGNHDGWNGPDSVERAFEAAGIPVLRNERATVAGILVAGLDDPEAGGPDRSIVADLAPPAIIAVHDPDVAAGLPGTVGLVVAGHTHGGQVALPLYGSIIQPTRRRFDDGLSAPFGRPLFVTPGIGTSIVPVRIGVPPTVDVLLLLPPAPAPR